MLQTREWDGIHQFPAQLRRTARQNAPLTIIMSSSWPRSQGSPVSPGSALDMMVLDDSIQPSRLEFDV